MKYQKKSPCNNCPYRKDAPLQLWSKEEFRDLQVRDQTQMGAVYGCHKADGHICVGFLMDQDKRDFPSLALRVQLTRSGVTRKYLDALKSKVDLFESIEEMCHANYPEL